MKYTVVIRQPVPEDLQAQLCQELSQQFELTTDQAAKLASRRSGRLMKPTSRKRADRLIQVFQGVGAQVTLEEVREELTLIQEPLAAMGQPDLAGGAQLGSQMPVPVPEIGTPYSEHNSGAGNSMTGSSFSAYNSDSRLASGGLDGTELFAGSPTNDGGVGSTFAGLPMGSADWDSTGVLMPSDPLHATSSSVHNSSSVQSGVDLITPTQVHSGVPELNLGGLSTPNAADFTNHAYDAATAVLPFPDQNFADQNFSGQNFSGQNSEYGVNVMETQVIMPGDPMPGMSIPGVSMPGSDDAWADFTGSLNNAPAASTVQTEGSNTASVMMLDNSLDTGKGTQRSSLLRRVLVSTLLPLGLFTLLTLGFLVYQLPRAQRELISENAQAVAVAVGSNLDVTDQNTVYAQLDSLIKRSSVGFVQVNLPDGTTFFRSKNPSTDGPLGEQVNTWVKTHPENSTFVQSGSLADSYRFQLSALEQVGAENSDAANALRASAEDPASQKSTTTTYLLSGINVTQNEQGDRSVGQGIKPGKGSELYNIVVGVPSDAAFTQLRNTLLLVLGVALIAFVVASLLAARTARAVVQPIERLVRAADAISMGDLDKPVVIERNDEIGDLAQALERMRLSLEAAMERLRRRRKGA
jgi:HAMP domain-containing protein